MHIYNPHLYLNTAHVAAVLFNKDVEDAILVLKCGSKISISDQTAQFIIDQLSKTPVTAVREALYGKESGFDSWWEKRKYQNAAFNSCELAYEAWCAAKQDLNNG